MHTHVPIPYHLTENDLILDPASEGETIANALSYFTDKASQDDEVLERLFRATVVLKAANPTAPLAECITTAIIWEVG